MESKSWVVRAMSQVTRLSTEPPRIGPRGWGGTEAKPPASQVTEIPDHPLMGLKALAGQGLFWDEFISLDSCLVLLLG